MGQLNLAFQEQAKQFIPDGEISGDIALSGGVGMGIKKVLYASGGLTGKLKPDWKIVLDGQDYFKLNAMVQAYVKAGIACFEGVYNPKSLQKECTLLEYPDSKRVLGTSGMSTLSTMSEDESSDGLFGLLNTNNYNLKDLSYLEEGSVFTANTQTHKHDLAPMEASQEWNENTFKTNIYRESETEIAQLPNGGRIAVWLDNDSSDINTVYLYYSIYKGGSWTSPRILYKDGTMDNAPTIKVINGTAYVVWQNANRSFEAKPSLKPDDIAGSFDISVAIYDASTDNFAISTMENEHLDMMPCLCGDDDNVYVVWVNNSGDDWLGNNAENTVFYSKLNGGSWFRPTATYSKLNSISSIAADYHNELNIAYCVDMDGDLTTVDDSRVYENGVPVSGDNSSSDPIYSDHTLYWYSNSNVVTSKSKAEEGSLNIERYCMIDKGGTCALIYTTPDGLKSKLMIAYYNEDSETWGNGMPLGEETGYVGDFSAYTNEDGEISVLFNSIQVKQDDSEQDPYGSATLKFLSVPANYDLSLDSVYYEEDHFNAGNKMPLTLEMTNRGNQVLKGVTVELKEKGGETIDSVLVEDTIVPGESLITVINYPVAADVKEQDVDIMVQPQGQIDSDTTNNCKNLNLTFEHLDVENISYGYTDEGKTVVSANIVNRGYHTQTNVSVELTKSTPNGKILESRPISGIEPLSICTESFEIDANQNDVYYVVVRSADGQVVDSDFVSLYSPLPCDDTALETIEITACKAILSKNTFVYDGLPKTPSVSVSYGEGVLKEGVDYEITYRDNTGIGKATTIIRGKGNYSGSMELTFQIIQNQSLPQTQPQPQQQPQPVPAVKAVNTISVTEVFIKTVNTKKAQTFKLGASAHGAKLRYKSSNRNVTVKDGKVTIKKGFVGKVSIGITATETDRYLSAYKTVTLTVNPSKTDLANVRWDKKKKVAIAAWKKNTTGKGYELQYTSDKKFKKGVKKVNIKKNKTINATIKKLKKGTWYFRIRTVNGKCYSVWSKIKSIRVK